MTRRLTGMLAAVLMAAVMPQSASAEPSWRDLHRSLNLREVAPGATCPVSSVDERVDWERINIFGAEGIGPGPAYPGLGGSANFTTNQDPTSAGWFAGKVFWYVKPSYPGRVLIRGQRLDGPQAMRFSRGGRTASELRIKRTTTVEWDGQPEGSRGVPSYFLLQASGCYGIQIDGAGFSRQIVFSGSTE
jgi:hypothetical protein